MTEYLCDRFIYDGNESFASYAPMADVCGRPAVHHFIVKTPEIYHTALVQHRCEEHSFDAFPGLLKYYLPVSLEDFESWQIVYDVMES
jgi:hypothetical protein